MDSSSNSVQPGLAQYPHTDQSQGRKIQISQRERSLPQKSRGLEDGVVCSFTALVAEDNLGERYGEGSGGLGET